MSYPHFMYYLCPNLFGTIFATPRRIVVRSAAHPFEHKTSLKIKIFSDRNRLRHFSFLATFCVSGL